MLAALRHSHAIPTAMPGDVMASLPDGARLKATNRKTALVLASIACVFFGGVFATRFLGGPLIGIGILGSAVLLFLIVAIGRNLRDNQ